MGLPFRNCNGAGFRLVGPICLQGSGIFIFLVATALLGVDGSALSRPRNQIRTETLSPSRSRIAVSSDSNDRMDDLRHRRSDVAILCRIDFGVDGAGRRAGLDALVKRYFGDGSFGALFA